MYIYTHTFFHIHEDINTSYDNQQKHVDLSTNTRQCKYTYMNMLMQAYVDIQTYI